MEHKETISLAHEYLAAVEALDYAHASLRRAADQNYYPTDENEAEVLAPEMDAAVRARKHLDEVVQRWGER